MHILGEPRFLVYDSFQLLVNTVQFHPILSLLGFSILFGIVLGILRWKFERIDNDIVIFAFIICAIVLLLTCSLLTCLHV